MNLSDPEGTACPVCARETALAFGADEARRVGPDFWQITPNGRFFTYRRCGLCGLVYCHPLPTEDELATVYSGRYAYHLFRSRRHLKVMQGIRRFRRVRRLLSPKDERGTGLLDVGCGEGHFLRAARSAGWRVQGIDLHVSGAVGALRKSGIDVWAGRFEEVEYPDASFDCITLWHCLEHLRDPQAALTTAARLLRPEGRLLVAVPNLNATGLRKRGLYWTWLQEPFIHLWHLSARCLRRLLPESLQIVHVTSADTYDGQLFLATLAGRGLNRMGRWIPLPADALRARPADPSSSGAPRPPFSWYGDSLRMLGYAGYVLLRPLLLKRYEDHLRGSELVWVARKKPAS